MSFDAAAEALTLTALGLLVYTYAGYPILLWLWAKAAGRSKRTETPATAEWPTVTVIISAYNEEAVIGRRIENLLEQDYPKDRMQILIGSDGSTDGMCDRVRRYRFAGIHLAAFPERRGKASILNDLAARATGEYLVFTDAATVFYPDSIRQLIAGFSRYPKAVVIGGKLELQCPETARNADSLYWRYEMHLKTAESDIGAGLGASGAIYTIRRKDYQPLPPQTMADDLLEPMLIRLRTAGDVVLCREARARQATPKHMTDEFHRRVRTGSGIAHVLSETWKLLLPQWGAVAWAYWSHKTLRLLGPWILLTAIVGNLWLLDQWPYRVLFAMQAGCYGLALSAGRLRALPLIGKAAIAARYFLVLNVALAMGSLKFMCGLATPTWNRTTRPAEPVPVSALPGWTDIRPQEQAQEQRPAA